MATAKQIYKTRQNKKTLGINNLKGISVRNIEETTGYSVLFVAETRNEGNRYYNGQSDSVKEATKMANEMFKSIYGDTRSAKKAGYWNVI
jgi:hypothetical protein